MSHRFLFIVILAFTTLSPVSAWCDEQPIQFSIVESDPFLSGQIGLDDTLYIKLAYKSDHPVRFRMEPFAAGKKIATGAVYNPAPLYPPGEGEALVWIAFRQPVAVDEIRVTAADEHWQVIGTLRISAALEWSTSVTKHTRADWASRLSHAQQEDTSRHMRQSNERDDWIRSLTITFGWIAILGYFVLQPWTIWRFTGGWRTAALLPMIAAIPLFGHAIYGLSVGSNLWPIGLIFFMPFAFAYLVVVAGIKWWVS